MSKPKFPDHYFNGVILTAKTTIITKWLKNNSIFFRWVSGLIKKEKNLKKKIPKGFPKSFIYS